MIRKIVFYICFFILNVNCFGSDESNSITIFYETKVKEFSTFRNQSKELMSAEIMRNANDFDSITFKESVDSIRRIITSDLVSMQALIDNIGHRNDSIHLPEDQGEPGFDFKRWVSEKCNIHIGDEDIPDLHETFHNHYNLGAEHIFQVNYNRSVPYNGNVTCNRSSFFGTCPEVIQYNGNVNCNGTISATCNKEHHRCLCREVGELSIALTEKVTQYEDLKREFAKSKELTNELLMLKHNASKILETVDMLGNQVTQNLKLFNQLRTQLDSCAKVIDIGVAFYDSMETGKKTISMLTIQMAKQQADHFEKTMEGYKRNSEEKSKEIAENKEKIDKMSTKLFETLDEKHKEFFEKIDQERRSLIENYDSKIHIIQSEKSAVEERYYTLRDDFTALQSKKSLFFRLLLQVSKTSQFSEEVIGKIDEFKRNFALKSFKDLVVLVEAVSLES